MDVWFLRYEEQQTEFFVILHHFLHFNPLITQEIKNLKKLKKKTLRDIIFTHVSQKPQSYDIQFMRHGMQQT